MGQNHARVYSANEDCTLVAISDPNPEQLEKVAKRYGVKGYLDYKEMLQSDDIDAVSISVPTSLHKEVAVHALNEKKHVLLEKPIASNEEEAMEIIDCAKSNGVKLMIGHIERFNPAVIELKKRLADLGEIYKIDVQRIGPFPGRITDVGVIIDLSVHDIDIIHFLINSHPTRIYAETQQKLHPNHEDSVTALMRYGNEIKATLNINYLSPTKVRELQVFGKKGMFKVNYLNQDLFFYENSSFASNQWIGVSEGDMKKISINKKEPLQVEIESFISCILENTEPSVSGQHGLEVLKIANLLATSANEKKIIER